MAHWAPGPPLSDPIFVALVSEDELHNVIANGRRGTLMPAWLDSAGGPLTQQQVSALVTGIKRRGWKTIAATETENAQNIYPSAPPLVAPEASKGDAPRRAKTRFRWPALIAMARMAATANLEILTTRHFWR